MTDRYAVFGNPLGHSKSPLIHTTFAAEFGEDMDYGKIEAPLDGFAAALEAFRDAGGKGCNVTAPFKLEAFALATERTEAAELAGATNTLRFEGGAILADNTDGAGLVRDIVENLGHRLKGKRVLLLGAGGAARGAALPILRQRPAAFDLLNRTVAKAEAVRDLIRDHGEIGIADPAAVNAYDIVINATSASLVGACPALPRGVFADCGLAYDLAYGVGLSPFLAVARAAGVPFLADGVGMLVEQAAAAFQWWRGKRPQTRALIEALTIPLS